MWAPFKKKRPPSSGYQGYGSSRTPTNRIIALSSQGLSEPEIIRTLKEEGYSPSEVDQGMKEALRGVIVPSQPAQRPMDYGPDIPRPQPYQDMPRPQPYQEIPRPSAELPRYSQQQFRREQPVDDSRWNNPELNLPELPGYRRQPARPYEREDDDLDMMDEEPQPLPPRRRFPPEPPPLREIQSPVERIRGREERVDELAESIAEEKWSDFKAEISSLRNSMKTLERRMEGIEKKVSSVPMERLKQVDEIRTDVDSYKRSISEISEKTEAVERALKDSLVPMMETMRSLSDAVKTIKRRSGE